MKKWTGLWIDHRKAVIVTISEAGEEIQEIASNMEKHVRFTGGTDTEDGPAEDVRDRQFGNHLNSYYDRLVNVIRDADSILIFGPGEAKPPGDHSGNEGTRRGAGDSIGNETVSRRNRGRSRSCRREHARICSRGHPPGRRGRLTCRSALPAMVRPSSWRRGA